MRLIWFLGLASLVLLVGLGVYLAPLEPSLVALQLTFDPVAFQRVLAAWRPDGVARFRAHLPLDCVLLLCYGYFGYLLACKTRVFGPLLPTARRWLVWAMPGAAVCDVLENALHGYLTSGALHAPALAYLGAGISASLKFVLIGVFLMAVVVAMVMRKTQARYKTR